MNNLVNFAKKHYDGFRRFPKKQLRLFFEKYRETTVVDIEAGKIYGFLLYQQWPDQAHFLCACSIRRNPLTWLRREAKKLHQKVTWFDEDKMRLMTICQ